MGISHLKPAKVAHENAAETATTAPAEKKG
jgi:hypothetical protein